VVSQPARTVVRCRVEGRSTHTIAATGFFVANLESRPFPWFAKFGVPNVRSRKLPCAVAPVLLCLVGFFQPHCMTLEHANELIKSCAAQMNERYKKVVFDEWAIVSLVGNKGRLLSYFGPRKAGFQENFLADAGPLRSGLLTREYQEGDFEFARHGIGTGFESFMVLGKGIFLICNNTVQSMDGITQDPHWLSAQEPFVDLSEKFRADPLVL